MESVALLGSAYRQIRIYQVMFRKIVSRGNSCSNSNIPMLLRNFRYHYCSFAAGRGAGCHFPSLKNSARPFAPSRGGKTLKLIRVSSAGMREAAPHDVVELKTGN